MQRVYRLQVDLKCPDGFGPEWLANDPDSLGLTALLARDLGWGADKAALSKPRGEVAPASSQRARPSGSTIDL